MSLLRCSVAALVGLLVLPAAPLISANLEKQMERIEPVPADEQIPLIDFFRPSLLGYPRLNASGTHYAALATTPEDKDVLIIGEIGSSEYMPLRGDYKRDIYDFHWMTDKHLLFSVSRQKFYVNGLYMVDLDSVGANHAIQVHSGVVVLAIPSEDPLQPLVWIHTNAHDRGRDAGVYTLDAKKRTGQDDIDSYGTSASVLRRHTAMNKQTAVRYIADTDGNLAYGISMTEGQLELSFLKNGEWHMSPIDMDEAVILGAATVAGEVIAAAPHGPGKPRALVRMHVASGEVREVLHQDSKYDADIGALYRHPVSHQVLGISLPGSVPTSVWFDEGYEALQKVFGSALPGKMVRILSSDESETKFIVAAFSDRAPASYYIIDLKAGTVGLMKHPRPWIDAERMAQMQIFRYRARDGKVIEGYLTVPEGASREVPAPLVVLPHGGPWVRDQWGWNPETQFLASRGYAVLQPNYRGSTGQDWIFSIEERHDFRKMHEDVTDGVKAALRTGVIDSGRIAILGSSFGGYLALSGVAFEKDLYRCAVSIAGVFDWELLMREAARDSVTSPRVQYWKRFVGDPTQDAEEFARRSPLQHVENVKVPVFVAHGKSDYVAHTIQSKRLVSELKEHDVPHVAHFTRGEGHRMAAADNRVELYTAIEAFLEEHLR